MVWLSRRISRRSTWTPIRSTKWTTSEIREGQRQPVHHGLGAKPGTVTFHTNRGVFVPPGYPNSPGGSHPTVDDLGQTWVCDNQTGIIAGLEDADCGSGMVREITSLSPVLSRATTITSRLSARAPLPCTRPSPTMRPWRSGSSASLTPWSTTTLEGADTGRRDRQGQFSQCKASRRTLPASLKPTPTP